MCLRPFLLALACIFTFSAANAQCVGENLIAALPADERDALYATAHAEPFATGNLWRATRGAQTIYLAGTFHLDDPRHDAVMTTLTPYLAQSKTLMVEAGPDEEAALQAQLVSDPTAMIDMAGSNLSTTLPPQEWEALTAALLQRGIPSSVAQTLRPWFVSMMLSIPPCALQLAATGRGLDKRLIAAAQESGRPVKALEPFDTVLTLFDGLSAAEQTTMIRNALQVEPQAADFLTTTADSYFDSEGRLIWEFSRHIALGLPDATPAQTEADFAKAEAALMSDRNRAWIPRILDALQDGPVFAAFGALHLSGEQGVLALLKAEGFTLEPL
ncbi:TraB/GumN family protein [Pseudorhodobacter turbinis]|uniref:TraB/GumN family protein n=1 Tax=Pseudorhodobacter turbinis TaxID=2500533 RepID=A0A4P8EHZ7_9RHOB|nr:TraB/GumN family protein [Pseudorhodobacter turbinis]QCO56393.1 TraB/GumN family protein [Pseudorhodobacter turbinis]